MTPGNPLHTNQATPFASRACTTGSPPRPGQSPRTSPAPPVARPCTQLPGTTTTTPTLTTPKPKHHSKQHLHRPARPAPIPTRIRRLHRTHSPRHTRRAHLVHRPARRIRPGRPGHRRPPRRRRPMQRLPLGGTHPTHTPHSRLCLAYARIAAQRRARGVHPPTPTLPQTGRPPCFRLPLCAGL